MELKGVPTNGTPFLFVNQSFSIIYDIGDIKADADILVTVNKGLNKPDL